MDNNRPFMNVIDRVPINIVGGDGSWLIADDGRRFVDLWGDEGVASLGYGGVFNDALRRFASDPQALQRLPDMYHSPFRAQVAEELCGAARYDRVFFCNSGTEANEAAIKLARRYWSKIRDERDRFGILTLAGNFHGRTGYSLAASDSRDSPYHKDGYGPTPAGFGVIHDDLDIEGVRAWRSDWTPAGYGPAIADDVNVRLCDWSNIAAVTMAPILGNNVVKTYHRSFWERLQALREQHGFLIIFDEVQVGMGRTGNFCCHHDPELTGGVRPDINAMGKGIAMGLPAACILADEEVARAFVPGVHFSTFGGTLLSMYMMREVIGWINAHLPDIRAKHDRIWSAFSEWRRAGLLSAFDGAGVHWGFTPNWDTPKGTITGNEVCERARDNGVLMCTHRPYGPIRFTPPLNVDADTLGFALEAVRKTLADFHEG